MRRVIIYVEEDSSVYYIRLFHSPVSRVNGLLLWNDNKE